MRFRPPTALLLAGLACALACGAGDEADGTATAGDGRRETTPSAETPPERPDPAALADRGRAVYGQVCIACHAMDPNQEGGIGPAVAGSSLELLRAKVIHNEYPPGYAPKRDTRNMVPLPHLESDLPALAAYLERAARGG